MTRKEGPKKVNIDAGEVLESENESEPGFEVEPKFWDLPLIIFICIASKPTFS